MTTSTTTTTTPETLSLETLRDQVRLASSRGLTRQADHYAARADALEAIELAPRAARRARARADRKPSTSVLRSRAFAAALEAIGGLSDPSKMPCLSYSTPADACILGSLLRKMDGTTCSSCYAMKGCYVFASTRRAMARRLSIVRTMLASPVARAEWVASFAVVLLELERRTLAMVARNGKPGANDGRFFRWHDSGDLQGVTHLEAIVAVCEATPSVRHWLPTREAGMVKAFLSAGGSFPPNLEVRVSLSRVDQVAPAGLTSISEVSLSGVHSPELAPAEGFQTCIAYQQEGACDDCRACWDHSVNVSYPRH